MKMTIILVLLCALSAFATELPDHPQGPDSTLTPGALCRTPNRHRYPENIPYCDRLVDRELKEQVFANYRKRGYTLSEPRNNYKIDHFIPLCAGGSNEITNLWPQHSSIYHITDEIEGLGCSKLQIGRIKQRDLLTLIKKAKRDLKEAQSVVKYLYTL